MGPFKCYVMLFFWKLDPHPPPRNANNIEHYTFVMLFPENQTPPHPHLRYVTLEWPPWWLVVSFAMLQKRLDRPNNLLHTFRDQYDAAVSSISLYMHFVPTMLGSCHTKYPKINKIPGVSKFIMFGFIMVK